MLSDKELEVMRNSIPSTRHGSSHMFRNLRDKGEQSKSRRKGEKSIAYDRKEISTRVFRRIRSLENTSYERVSRASRDTFLRERGNISSVKKKKKKGKENFRIYYFPEQQRNNRRSIRIRIIIIIILVPISLSRTMG